MPPTPNQLLVQQDPTLLEAPKIQEQVTPEVVVKEGEVSMPNPQQWIGNIDYGMNWNAIGAKAFDVGKNIYEDVLKYSVNKTNAQLKDLQYDFQTQMRNQFAASVNPNPQNYIESESMSPDFNTPFAKSSLFQEQFKQKANEIIGFKDSDGNLIDIFKEDKIDPKTGKVIEKGFDVEGYGMAWFSVIDAARQGLYDISRDAEKVQSDLLKSFKDKTEKSNILKRYKLGNYVSTTELDKIKDQVFPYTSGNAPVNDVVEAIGPTNINFNVKAQNGYPVLIVQPDRSVTINPEATQDDLINTLGSTGYRILLEKEMSESAMSAQGTNLPPKASEEVKQILSKDNISPADAIKLYAELKYMSPEKLTELQTKGENYTPLERARLMVAYTFAAIPGREEVTPETFRQKINNVKTPQANSLFKLVSFLQREPGEQVQYSVTDDLAGDKAATKQFLGALLGADANIQSQINNENDVWFRNYITRYTNIQAPLYSALLEYKTLLLNGVDKDTALKSVSQSLNSIILIDDTGNPTISRNVLHSRLGKKGTSEENPSTGYIKELERNRQIAKKQCTISDTKVDEFFTKATPQQLAFTTIGLQANIDRKDYPNLIDSVDGQFIPSGQQYISPQTRIALLQSANTVIDSTTGQNRSSSPTLSETLRVAIATNSTVIKHFNDGKPPKNQAEALKIAGTVYQKIGPAEFWGWNFKYESIDDQIINAKDGGIPFNLESIFYTDLTTNEKVNLLDNNRVIVPANRKNIRFTDQSNGIPYTMLPNLFLTQEGFQEGYKNFDRLLKGQRPNILELDLGTNPTTDSSNSGLVSAAQLLATMDNDKRQLYPLILPIMTEEQKARLLVGINKKEARISAKDPETISYVCDILARSYEKPKELYFQSLVDVLNNEDLFEYIITSDSDGDDKITQMDIINNMHIAAIGYNLNSNFKEYNEMNYPKPMESLFWNTALEKESNRSENKILFPYTDTVLTTTEKKGVVQEIIDRYVELNQLGMEEAISLSKQLWTDVPKALEPLPQALAQIPPALSKLGEQLPQVATDTVSGFGDLLKATGETLFPVDLIIPTEYRSVWAQVAEQVGLDNLFQRQTVIEEIETYKNKYGKLPPNITEQQYKDIKEVEAKALQENFELIPFDGGSASSKKYKILRFDGKFNTILSKEEEEQFKIWAFNNIPSNIYNYSEDKGQYDYDYRGAWFIGLTPDKTGHWPDTFKKPSHPTFSTDSAYSKYAPKLAGQWYDKPNDNKYPEGAVIDENTGQYYLKPKQISQQKQVSPGAVSDKPYMDLINEFEGLKTEAYWDDNGKVWTIGKGTTTYRDGTPVKKGDKITKEEADLLTQDFIDTQIIPRLQETIPTWNEMNLNQKSALISFAYNMKNGQNFYGNKKFEILTKAVSSVDNFKNVPAALKKYIKSGGKVLKGLIRRRKAEAALWSR